jgi:hypothetical protein
MQIAPQSIAMPAWISSRERMRESRDRGTVSTDMSTGADSHSKAQRRADVALVVAYHEEQPLHSAGDPGIRRGERFR